MAKWLKDNKGPEIRISMIFLVIIVIPEISICNKSKVNWIN
jgi:hypothetical protein